MFPSLVEAAGEIRRAALASLRRPSLSPAVLATIAVGLGAASAVLSVARAALVEPLPYHDPARLLRMVEAPRGSGEPGRTSLPLLLDWQRGLGAFSAIAGYEATNVNALMPGGAEMVRGWRVTPGFFAVLGVAPSIGRVWPPDTGIGTPGSEVVISDRLASRLGGGTVALSLPLTIDGETFTIIGVMPRGFHFGDDADLWLPLTPAPDQRVNRANRWLAVVGRLKDGTDLGAARRDLEATTRAIAAEFPAEMEGQSAVASPLRDVMLGDVKPILLSLLAAVGVLLVITAANLGALMLLRNLDRRSELAVRVALGASRRRLAAQLFLEGLLLAMAGAIAGLALGSVGVKLMTGVIPAHLRAGMPYLAEVRLDPAAEATVLGIAIAMAAAFALWPAWHAISGNDRVGHGMRLSAGGQERRIRRVLVTSQLGLTVVLLIVAAQLAGSLFELRRQPIGVRDPDRVLTLNVAASGPAYSTDGAVQAFYESLLERLAAEPGVTAAAAVNELPLSGSGVTSLEPVEEPIPQAQRPAVAMRIIAGDYFSAMGMPPREGRLLSSRDRAGAPPAAVVSASFAARFGDAQPVVGRRFRLTRTGNTEWEVVGVVEDVHMSSLDVPSPPTVYVHHLQAAENRMPLVVRTSRPAEEVAASVRALIRSMDPGIPLYSVSTLGQQLRDSDALFTRRFPLAIGGVFAGAALLLAIVGLYSLAAHEALSRRRELTIRQVLGATPGAVRAGLLRDGLMLAAVGISAGALLAVPASRLVQSLLYGVRATDPWIYGGVAAAVLTISIVAVAWPAWRSSASDLTAGLRA